jgi:hypothetical protein
MNIPQYIRFWQKKFAFVSVIFLLLCGKVVYGQLCVQKECKYFKISEIAQKCSPSFDEEKDCCLEDEEKKSKGKLPRFDTKRIVNFKLNFYCESSAFRWSNLASNANAAQVRGAIPRRQYVFYPLKIPDGDKCCS